MKRYDFFTLVLIFALGAFGILFVWWSTQDISFRIYEDRNHIVLKQLGGFIVGFVLIIVMSFARYSFARDIGVFFLILTIIFLALVFIPGIGESRGGARRWVSLGLFDFQPSSLAKITVLFYLASALEGGRGREFKEAYLPSMIGVFLVTVLILIEPDFSTAVLLSIMALSVLIRAGMSPIYLLILLFTSLPVVISLVTRSPVRLNRILSFLDPFEDPLGRGYNLLQSLRAIHSGGYFGKGFGESHFAKGALPAAHTDFAWSLLAEQGGLFLAIIFVAVIFWLGYRLIISVPRLGLRGGLFVMGFSILLMVQTFINISVCLGLLPPTGIPLPFLSVGLSDQAAYSIGFGISLSLMREADS